jgi:two-component system sensor histidine kinase KdpD
MNNANPIRRGHLKLLLGFAAGVGKTYRMLEEGLKLKEQGIDIIIGYFESHGRKDTIAKAEGLETIRRVKIQYRGIVFEEMDTAAILARKPAVCLVDELAHTNIPGSERTKRWEDVFILLDAGIDVMTTMNVQHLESLNDQIWQITGVRVRETLPDWVLEQADEVVMIDATPAALLNRLKRGVVYEPEKAKRALENFFKESTLVALRELALRQTAHEVEVRQKEIGGGRSPAQSVNAATLSPKNELAPADEKILIHVTEHPSAAMLIRRGKRMADYLRAECFAVYVSRRPDLSGLLSREREAVEKHLNFARNLRIEARVLQDENTAQAIVDFSRRHQVTQIFLARQGSRAQRRLLQRNMITQVVELAKDIRITVVAERMHHGSGKPSLTPI